MSEVTQPADDFNPAMGLEVPSLAEAGFEELLERRTPGLVWRFFATQRHFLGLILGGWVDWVRTRRGNQRRGLRFRVLQMGSWAAYPWVKRSLRKQSFPVQLRRRLEILGPSYIKLGQVLSLRQDLLPPAVTAELQNLLDRLPAVPYLRFLELVAQDLGRPVNEIFAWIDPRPTGSASIAQSHRATTLEGDSVILKVVKPGIRSLLQVDAKLLRLFSRVLQLFWARYQPRRVADEFIEYTLREVDLEREADNAETFAANFADSPNVVFPKIYRRSSGPSVLCMEFFDGLRPDSAAAAELEDGAKDRIIDTGVSVILDMLYRDGFFHADLHPGNLLILEDGNKAGFIDLGMVGRLEEDTRRSLLYYYYCLVTGDASNAARYLTALASDSPGADREGFRRTVEEVSRRWSRHANFEDFSLAQLILESVTLAGRYRLYFPVELVLMTKALVTFEGVGQMLKPGFDVAAASQRHITNLFLNQFNPMRLARESLRSAPDLIDAVVKGPMLITEGLRLLEKTARQPPRSPLTGMRGTLFGGFCLVAAAILLVGDTSGRLWPVAIVLLLAGLVAALSGGGG